MEETAKYRSLRPISIQTLFKNGACISALTRFAEIVMGDGYSPIKELDADYAQKVAESIGERSYLLDHDFIEKVEEEKFYHRGQRFRDGREIYRLVGNGATAGIGLIEEETGNWWNTPLVPVKDNNKITQAEFDKIIGGDSKDFQLIEESSPSPSRDAGESSLNGEARS